MPSAVAAALSSWSAEISVSLLRPWVERDLYVSGRCQLDGVVGPQAVGFRQPFGVGQDGGCDFQDGVLVGGIVAELGQERWYGGGHGTAPASVGDGGNDVNPSEARQKNLVGGSGIGQALDPSAADLGEVTLHNAAGVEDERGHSSAPLTDDGFRERFPLEGDRLEDRPGRGIGGDRQARYPTGFQQVLLELGFGHPGAVRRRWGVLTELLQRVANDVVLGAVAPRKDLIVHEPLEFSG